MIITRNLVDDFQRDGVVVLRGVFTDWMTKLSDGADANLANPSWRALAHSANNPAGRFIEDFCCWTEIHEYRDFVFLSPLGTLAAQLMRSRSVQFFHDHYLHKEARSGMATPWHQDSPYYCVDGKQCASFWIPLEPRGLDASLRCAAGSHRLPKELQPTSWSTEESFYDDDTEFMDLPDIENGDFEIRSWAIEPGDAVAFDFRIIHSASANASNSVSRTISFRVLGDDMRFRQRQGRTSPNFPDIDQQDGDRLREDRFPVIWPKLNNGTNQTRRDD